MIKNKRRKNPYTLPTIKGYLKRYLNREVAIMDKFLAVKGNLQQLDNNTYGILKDLPDGKADAEFKINDIDQIDFESNIIYLSENPKSEIIN